MAASKLTLLIDKNVIENAKQYTKRHHTTLSRLVTQMLARLPQEHGKALPPSITSLLGVLPADVDGTEHRTHLEKKHKL